MRYICGMGLFGGAVPMVMGLEQTKSKDEIKRTQCDICAGKELPKYPGAMVFLCKKHWDLQYDFQIEAKEIWDLI